jgi:hypothetical protein
LLLVRWLDSPSFPGGSLLLEVRCLAAAASSTESASPEAGVKAAEIEDRENLDRAA